MSKALIQTANTSQQAVAINSFISLGSVLRRFGCNCRLNGNSIELEGEGYYIVDAVVTVAPTAVGNVTIALTQDDVIVPGTTSISSVSTAGNSTTIPISTTIRLNCCGPTKSLKVVLLTGAGTVSNIAVRVLKV